MFHVEHFAFFAKNLRCTPLTHTSGGINEWLLKEALSVKKSSLPDAEAREYNIEEFVYLDFSCDFTNLCCGEAEAFALQFE